MTLSVEWRVREGADAIVVVDEAALRVTEVVTPDAAVLKDYLEVTGDLEAWRKWTAWRSVDGDGVDPETWGELVLGRADDGEVVDVNPDLYWEGIRRWFRAHGGFREA